MFRIRLLAPWRWPAVSAALRASIQAARAAKSCSGVDGAADDPRDCDRGTGSNSTPRSVSSASILRIWRVALALTPAVCADRQVCMSAARASSSSSGATGAEGVGGRPRSAGSNSMPRASSFRSMFRIRLLAPWRWPAVSAALRASIQAARAAKSCSGVDGAADDPRDCDRGTGSNSTPRSVSSASILRIWRVALALMLACLRGSPGLHERGACFEQFLRSHWCRGRWGAPKIGWLELDAACVELSLDVPVRIDVRLRRMDRPDVVETFSAATEDEPAPVQ